MTDKNGSEAISAHVEFAGRLTQSMVRAGMASRRTAERAGFVLVDTVAATPEALALELESELCRYVAERP